ncbi:MAG: 3-keto-5-aminohexanoate cleavage protein [Actinobacteria bacterium]|nr:3-keto-5-aminohexanoate cleavage protein [Actinomycetota bacterium]
MDGRDRTVTEIIWSGVDEKRDRVAELQPRWDVPERVVIKADIGHHYRADGVIEHSGKSIAAGACSVHLHIRGAADEDSGDLGLWREVTDEIQRRNGNVVIDSSPRGATHADQMAWLEQRFADIVPVLVTWERSYLESCVAAIEDTHAKVELDIWDGSDVALATHYIQEGVIKRPASWLLVPSSPYYGTPMRNPMLMAKGLTHQIELIREVDPEGLITVCASGRASSYLTGLAILLGHHVRPGLGESPWRFPHSDHFEDDSALLVRDVVDVARGLGRSPETPDGYRSLLGI